MPITSSAKKALRQARVRRIRNIVKKVAYKKAVVSFRKLVAQKKFDEAQAELTKAAQIDPANGGKFYFNLGAVFVNTGNADLATTSFKKAIELDPNYAEAYYQYGLSLMAKATIDNGKTVAPAGTQEAFQKYLEQAPSGPNAETSKAMLASMGATVQTNFSQPKAAPAPAQQKKKQ